MEKKKIDDDHHENGIFSNRVIMHHYFIKWFVKCYIYIGHVIHVCPNITSLTGAGDKVLSKLSWIEINNFDFGLILRDVQTMNKQEEIFIQAEYLYG